MSYIIQNRKNDKRYSPKERRKWWAVLTEGRIIIKRYCVGPKLRAQKETDEFEYNKRAEQHGLVSPKKLMADILNDYLSQSCSKNKDHFKSIICSIKKSLGNDTYSAFNLPYYYKKCNEWYISADNPDKKLDDWTVQSYEKTFRAAIRQFDPNCIFRRKKIKYVAKGKYRKEMVIPDNEFWKIYNRIDNLEIRDFILFLRYTGIRDGTAIKMKWKLNLSFPQKSICITSNIGKGGTKAYEIPIDGRIFEMLVRRKKSINKIVRQIGNVLVLKKGTCFRRKNSHERAKLLLSAADYVFPWQVLGGVKQFYENCRKAFTDACLELDLPKYHLHDLRRTAADEWYRQTRNIVLVSKALGHTSIAMTVEYLKEDVNIKYIVEPVKNNPYKHTIDTLPPDNPLPIAA